MLIGHVEPLGFCAPKAASLPGSRLSPQFKTGTTSIARATWCKKVCMQASKYVQKGEEGKKKGRGGKEGLKRGKGGGGRRNSQLLTLSFILGCCGDDHGAWRMANLAIGGAVVFAGHPRARQRQIAKWRNLRV